MDDLRSDTQLLSKFVTQGDEEAFSSLIARHAKVAYSAVVMETGAENLAEEACQLTFLQLAKEAKKLRKRKTVAGWIFLSARNHARNLRREEIRRRKREERYMEQKMNLDEDEQVLPESTRPLIIGALDKLKPLEKELVVLRFFKGLSFADLGNQLGLSPDAARMRLQRSLEKLNHLLKRRGVTSSIALLTSTISSQGVQTLPPSLITNLKINVLAAQAGASTAGAAVSSLIIMKTKMIAGGAVAASLLVGTTVYVAKNQSDDSGKASSQAEASSQVASATSSSSVRAASDEGMDKKLKRSAAERNKSSSDSIRNKIPQVYLKQGALMLEMLQAEEDSGTEKGLFSEEFLGGIDKGKALAEVEVIGLRLELNEEQKEKLASLVEANFDQRQSFEAGSEPDFKDVLPLLEGDNAAVDFMALMILEEKGEMDPELRTYLDDLEAEYEQIEKEHFSQEDEGGIPPNLWKSNDEILSEIGNFLSADQRRELEAFITEQEAAEIDRRVFKRVDQISSNLGLTIEEKADLRTFLEQNPNASQDEVAEIFTPELQKVLKKEKRR